MATSTRTLNPLPFEHLEPHRFEDLVRQLAYDFRTWRALEATGGSGSDDGYDIRGLEIVHDPDEVDAESAADDERVDEKIDEPEEHPSTDRRWLIQCKREQAIGPSKVQQYFDDIPITERNDLYGLVFAASCKLSKKSRDLLIRLCREAGIAECYVWSRAEIEDMLFQPRNDGLLFAYFGISLRIRQRSSRSQLRSRLAAKRKAYRALGEDEYHSSPILLRDPEERRYPYIDDEHDRADHLWQVITFVGHHPLGIKLHVGKHLAYLDDEGTSWDMADAVNDATDSWRDPWDEDKLELRAEIHEHWQQQFTPSQRAMIEIEGIIAYDEIIDIDGDGDSQFDGPHVYVNFDQRSPPFSWWKIELSVPPARDAESKVDPARPGRMISPELEHRKAIFPAKFRGKRRRGERS